MIKKTPEEYIKLINQYPNAKFPEIGKIYIFVYLFNQTINQKKSYNQLKDEGEIKFYDFLPATFIWKIKMDTSSFFGFNLHNIPIMHRRRWVELLQHSSGTKTPKKEGEVSLLDGRLKRLIEEPGLLRQYNMRKVRKLKEIPIDQWTDLLQFDVNTSFKATSEEIMAKYISFIK